MTKDCNKCGKEIDFENGSCAILMAFCVNHSTSLSNIALCRDCYANIEKDLRALNEKANLRLIFGTERGKDGAT